MQRSRNEPDFVSACVSLASAGERGVLQQRTCDMSRAVGLRVNKLWPHHGPHILKLCKEVMFPGSIKVLKISCFRETTLSA